MKNLTEESEIMDKAARDTSKTFAGPIQYLT